MKDFKEIFHETLLKLPMQEFEKRTFNLKKFLQNEHLQQKMAE